MANTWIPAVGLEAECSCPRHGSLLALINGVDSHVIELPTRLPCPHSLCSDNQEPCASYTLILLRTTTPTSIAPTLKSSDDHAAYNRVPVRILWHCYCCSYSGICLFTESNPAISFITTPAAHSVSHRQPMRPCDDDIQRPTATRKLACWKNDH